LRRWDFRLLLGPSASYDGGNNEKEENNFIHGKGLVNGRATDDVSYVDRFIF
jgi:hypothetical protein